MRIVWRVGDAAAYWLMAAPLSIMWQTPVTPFRVRKGTCPRSLKLRNIG